MIPGLRPIFITGKKSGWNISTAVFVGVRSVSSEASNPREIFFSPDGIYMYVASDTIDSIVQYTLSTPWVTSTASLTRSLSVSSQTISPSGLYFREDGLKMYIGGQSDTKVHEYTLGTAWNISTASYIGSYAILASKGDPRGVFLSSDGSKLYVTSDTAMKVYQFTLSTPWSIVSAVQFTSEKDISAQDTEPTGIFFSNDGKRMYTVGYTNDKVYQYALSVPWLITSANFVQAHLIASETYSPRGIFFEPNGLKMYVSGDYISQDEINEYNITS